MSLAEINNDLPRGILSAIAKVESNHNPHAYTKSDGYSGKASHGLFQIQLAAARDVGFKGKSSELMNPEVNIKYAALYLSWILKKTKGDVAQGLTCFNSGVFSASCKSGKYSKYSGRVFNEWVRSR